MPDGMRNLRKWLVATGTTQEALAARVGVTQSAVSLAVAGRNGVTLATLKAMADATGLSLDQLTDRAPYPIPEGE